MNSKKSSSVFYNIKQKQNTITCSNCFKKGHIHHYCKLPTISFGLIVFRYNKKNNEYEFLMVKRKDSFSYTELLSGKYCLHNTIHLQNIINEMTVEEKQRLITTNYHSLKIDLWNNDIRCLNNKTDEISKLKFEKIKNGFIDVNGVFVDLKSLIEKSNKNLKEQEWEFPKGRKNINERDIECALREFEEETGYKTENIKIIENIFPFEEIFIGSNFKNYKHKYFLAFLDENEEQSNFNYQQSEISKVEWKNYENCINSIRDISFEKKNILTCIYKLLMNYDFCYL